MANYWSNKERYHENDYVGAIDDIYDDNYCRYHIGNLWFENAINNNVSKMA
jgi:hypothetical protein